jgi:outer membrane receptor for ferrienterochelin and colicin
MCGFLLLAGLLPAVRAAETGTIQGVIVDSQGKPLPGVLVTATSRSLQGQRTVETNEKGVFRFPILPVGRYTLTFELMGFAPLKKTNVPVSLGSVTPLEVEMSSTSVEDMIVVEAEALLIEKDSADLSTRITSEELETIPSTTRNFKDMTKFVPGVTGVRINTVDGRTDGMPSIRGEGQYGNNYLIDGLSVRDPAVHSTGTPLNYDAIEEIQIITDGFSPEYGQSLGGTVNVITKSGGNTFSGEAAMIYESDALSSKETNSKWAANNDFTEMRPYFNIGGPILKDKLWFFTSYNYNSVTNTYEATESHGFTIGGDDQTDKGGNLFAKLTYGLSMDHSLSLSATIESSERDQIGIDSGAAQDARGILKRDQKRVRVNYKGLLSPNTVLEGKLGWIDRELTDEPMDGDLGPARYRDPSWQVYWNNYDSRDKNTRGRNDYAMTLTQFVDDLFGSHEFKTGLSYYRTESTRDLTFSGQDEDIFPDRMPGGSEFVFLGGEPYVYYDYSGAGVENETKGFGFFLQDKWSPIDKLNVLFGFRLDTQDVLNDAGDTLIEFKATDTIAPRLALAWDVTGNGMNVVKLGAGRFYDIVSTSLAEWGNTSNPYSFDRYSWGGPDNPSDADLHDPNNWGSWYDSDDDGEDEFHPGEPTWTQDPAHDPLQYDPDLKPIYKDEVLVEYDRAFGTRYAAKARYVWSRTRDLIEDVAFTIDDWIIVNFDRKRRDYKAAEFEFLGRPTDKLSFSFAYVWSEAKGTTPGQFERGGFQSSWGSGNMVGVFGDRPPWDANGDGVSDEDEAFWAELLGGLGGLDGDDGWYGYLPYSADHQVKATAMWQAPYEIYVGLGFEWNSGYHWQKRGWQPAYGGYLTFPEGRGVREMPSIYWLDLSITKRFELFNNQYLGLRLDVFNLTDADTPISYVQEWEEDADTGFGDVLKRQDPRSGRLTLTYSF